MCIKKFLLLFATAFVVVAAQAQTPNYAVRAISPNLLKNANSVVREASQVFTIKDIANTSLQQHKVITVFNQDADRYLWFVCYTSSFDKLTDASITEYDSVGAKLKSYNFKDLKTTGFGDGLVDDGIIYYFAVTAASYPITIEINSTEKFKGTLFYPSFEIQDDEQSVEKSSAQIIAPKNFGFRYKCLNTNDNRIETENLANITYSWTETDIPAKKLNKHSGPSFLYLPVILFAPNQFQMDDYAGNMSTWQSFGKWYGALISATNVLSPAAQAFYQNLVKDKTTDVEKAKTIYRYMQNTMRYVSIQLGIGGWKPFSADFVNTKKYGDCKALSNYMQAALSAVGIKSYPVINFAGTLKAPLTEDFPINSFNHVLLCIPQVKDSIWLECTSNSADFGELAAATQDHSALLVNEAGGALIHIPAANADDNCISTKSVINLNEDGSAIVQASFNSKGECKQQFIGRFYLVSNEDKQKFLYSDMKFKPADSLAITESDKFDIPFVFDLKMNYDNFPDFSTGSKSFISSRLHKIFNEYIAKDSSRKQDYYFDFPYKIFDTVELHYPQGFQPESLPKDKNYATPYTAYYSKYFSNTETKTITVITSFSVLKTVVKSCDYKALAIFSSNVSDDLNEKIVIDKKE